MSERYFSGYDGKTVMADVDVNGNSLELTIEDEKVKAIGNIPVGGGDESVWTDETFDALGDDDGDNILDENNEPIGGEDSETLWTSRDGVGFKAERAEADINGNSLELTIEDNKVVEIGGHTLNGGTIDAYTKTQTDTLLEAKQNTLTFDGTYDATTNPAATVATVESAIPTVMTGATSQAAGKSGLVPAPTVEEKDKFLKGDGTWTAPPEVNLANYYYDDHGNGLSAKRTSGGRPYGTTSLVGGGGNMNTYDLAATFYIDWGGLNRHFFSVNTVDSGASRIGFGTDSSNASAMRYLLPTPVANKYAKTNAEGKIVWGDVPSLPSPSIDDSLLLGQSDGSKTWTALERNTFGSLTADDGDEIQDETGDSIGDENSVELWASFNGTGFGAERAVADADGNNIAETYAKKGEASSVSTSYDAQTKTLTISL